jgi:hypothetical protein
MTSPALHRFLELARSIGAGCNYWQCAEPAAKDTALVVISRPWVEIPPNEDSKYGDPDQWLADTWAMQNVWNYATYLKVQGAKAAAITELARYYRNNFGLVPATASATAEKAIGAIWAKSFLFDEHSFESTPDPNCRRSPTRIGPERGAGCDAPR